MTFLSCLYGSERVGNYNFPALEFLSCLYGSELKFGFSIDICIFLSCLYGSELLHCQFLQQRQFSKLPIWQ